MAQPKQQTVIIGLKVEDYPTPMVASDKKACLDCGVLVWIAQKQLADPKLSTKNVDALCVDCYKKLDEGYELTEEHADYLEALRDSGVTNMWGAPAYLEREFGVTKQEARVIFNAWAKTKI